jgi:hypothetical protein
MARVTYESKDNAGHNFWVARYGRYAVRIDATPPRCLPVAHHPGGPVGPQGCRPDRDEAANAAWHTLMRLPAPRWVAPCGGRGLASRGGAAQDGIRASLLGG